MLITLTFVLALNHGMIDPLLSSIELLVDDPLLEHHPMLMLET